MQTLVVILRKIMSLRTKDNREKLKQRGLGDGR